MRILDTLVALASIAAAPRVVAATAYPAESPAPSDDEVSGWVEGKMQEMTLREKIGQMLMIDVRGTSLSPDLIRHLEDGAYGNVIFFEQNTQDEDQIRSFIKQLQDLAVVRTGVPMLVAIDQEGGPVNRLGEILGLKSSRYSARTIGQIYSFDEKRAKALVGATTRRLASRMRSLGFNMNLAPVLDLTDDATSYIYERSYGGRPEAVARIAAQFADVMREHRIVTTGKHFPNLSVTRPDSHQDLPILDRSTREMAGHELIPFIRLKNRLGAVMMGHVVVPGIDPKFPASVSYKAGRVLRGQVGWKGVVISDDLKMKALTDRYSLTEIVIRSLFAEVDLLLMAWGPAQQREVIDIIEDCVRRGKVPVSRIDRSVRRILALKDQFAR